MAYEEGERDLVFLQHHIEIENKDGSKNDITSTSHRPSLSTVLQPGLVATMLCGASWEYPVLLLSSKFSAAPSRREPSSRL